MARKLPRVRAGDVLRADDLNALYEALERLRLTVGLGSGLTLAETPGGTTLGWSGRPGMWIKIGSSHTGSAYAWTEQLPATGGTWVVGPASGTSTVDPARELNGNATVPANTIVRAWRAPQTLGILFAYDHC